MMTIAYGMALVGVQADTYIKVGGERIKMEQRELLRKGNSSVPDRFTLMLVLHLNDPDLLLHESSQFGAIVVDWYKARNSAAEAIILAAVVDPKYQKAVRDWFDGIHAMDVTLRPIFEKVLFRIALHNPDGLKVTEHEYQAGKRSRGGFLEKLIGSLRKKWTS
jgi:hypothetical protein